MKEIEAPKANPERISTIIEDAYKAKIALPDFQRPFIWPREDIEELLTSILQGYFIGTFLLLDTQADKPLFPALPIQGLHEINPGANPNDHTTIRLVLDGQQRITSLFYALYQPNIPLKKARHPHKFYLRLDMALKGDIDESVAGISVKDTRGTSEITKLVQDDKAIPFTLFRDSSKFYEWLYKKQKVWLQDEQKDIEALYMRFTNFMVPVIELKQDSSKANVVNIFERINRTGVSLSLFDLAVARLYMKGIRLRKLWKDYEDDKGKEVVKVAKPEFFIKLIAIFQGKEPRKGNLLDVIDSFEPDAFNDVWTRATDAMVVAYQRIKEEYKAFKDDLIPYSTIIVPLAHLLAEAKKIGAREEAYRRIDRWYWSSVLTQRYDSAVDTKAYQDAKGVLQWIQGNAMPEWIGHVASSNIDLRVDESGSAVYKGLMCLVVRRGAKDFLTGQPPNLNIVQDDHIFPKSIYSKDFNVNMFLNKTLIWKETNGPREKFNKKPSIFLQECLTGHDNDEDRLIATFETHLISRQAYEFLKKDDFKGFIAERERTIKATLDSIFPISNPLTPVNPSPTEEESSPDSLSTIIVGPGEENSDVGEAGDELPERHTLRLNFWKGLLDKSKEKTKLHANISPGHYYYIGTGAGKSGLSYIYAIMKDEGIVELYIDRGKESGEENRAIFDRLFENKNEIEKVFEGPLEWDRTEGNRSCKIRKRIEGGYRENLENWPSIQDSMIDAMIRLEKALKPYIEKLKT